MSITLFLVIITGLISYQALERPELKGKLILYPFAIKNRGEWFRFLSHGFVHANWSHLLINLFVLYQFGQVTEYMFQAYFGAVNGSIIFIFFYLSAIILSSLFDYLTHQNNPGYAALGASGATSAIVMTYVFFGPWKWFIFPPVPSLIFAILYLWYSNWMAKQGRDNIGHNAHFYGSLYGALFIVVFSLAFNPALLQNFLAMLLEGPTAPSF